LPSILRRLWRLRLLVPHLPRYRPRASSTVVAQAVVLRPSPSTTPTDSARPGQATGGGQSNQEVLLLLRTSPRAWEFPGGHVNYGEDPAHAVIRETREETSLTVRVDRLLGWYRRTGFRPHRSPVYVCSVAGGTLRGNWESVRVQWFSVDALPAGLFPWYRPIVQDAVRGLTHTQEQHQHLGWRAVRDGLLIHLRGILRPAA